MRTLEGIRYLINLDSAEIQQTSEESAGTDMAGIAGDEDYK